MQTKTASRRSNEVGECCGEARCPMESSSVQRSRSPQRFVGGQARALQAKSRIAINIDHDLDPEQEAE